MQCRYHSSILYIRRNILTYLSMLLVISMNITKLLPVIRIVRDIAIIISRIGQYP